MTFPLVLCSLIRIFAGELRNSPARMGGTLAKSKLSALGLHHPCKVCCRDGGLVDTRDLKSLGHNGCAGSSPARGTRSVPVNRGNGFRQRDAQRAKVPLAALQNRAHQTMGPIFLLARPAYPFISLIRRRLAKGRTAK